MQVVKRYIQPDPVTEDVEIPDGEGREDCSCGAVLKPAGKPEYDLAVTTIQDGCPHCRAKFPGTAVPGTEGQAATTVADQAELLLHPEPAPAQR